VFEFFVVWKFCIETRNTPLEDIVKYFDGEGVIIGGDAAIEKSRQLARETHEGGPEITLTTAEMPGRADMQPMETSLA
jgi:hypothetical protein